MRFVFIIAIFVLQSFSSENVIKDAEIVNNPLEEIKKIDESIKTLTADFTQEIFFKTAEIKQNVEGKIFFSKPGNLKIIHTKPQDQIIIIRNEKELTIVKPKDKQIIKTHWEKWKNSLEPRIKGLLELGRYREVASKEDIEIYKENDLKVIIIRSKKNTYILKIVFSKSNTPLRTELDMGDTSISTVFNNVKINDNISDGEFKYKNKDGFETLSL
ncbi:MAG: LolA family protein [Elusimicrobiales bacterium]